MNYDRNDPDTWEYLPLAERLAWKQLFNFVEDKDPDETRMQEACATLKSATRAWMAERKICERCKGGGWVCENHRTMPWEGTADPAVSCGCGGAGAPCPDCYPEEYK